jgi:prepilin-type processing-associated H-X9-DG protein
MKHNFSVGKMSFRASPRVFCRRQKRGRVEKSACNSLANPDFSASSQRAGTSVEMTMSHFNKAKHNINFAKKDVAVVLACLVFLLAGLGAVGDGGRERAKRTVCLANLKQLTAGCNVFANDNDSMLPLPTTGGYWLQDVEVKTVNFMLRAGLTRKMFYCPSNTTNQKYNDFWWMYSNASWNGKIFTNETGYVVLGYCYILQLSPVDINGNPQKPRTAIVRYKKDTEQKIWLTTTQEKNPAIRELCVDTIMGTLQTRTKYGWNFAQIRGGVFTLKGLYDRTNHLMSDGYPPGGNIGFLDGHGEWRIFDPEIVSGIAMPRYGNAPGFFW